MRWPKRHPATKTDTSRTVLTTPYERAAGVWDLRIGTARVQAKNWRLVALLALMVAFSAIAGLVYSYTHRPFHVHVVEINSKGEHGRIILADESYDPSDAQIGYLLAQLVELVRSRPLDPVVLRNNWEKAYTFLAGDAIATMNEYAKNNNGLDSLAGRPVARVVQITSVLLLSEISFQVHWIETEYIGGVVDSQKAYTGAFDIVIDPPTNEAELFRNPLGLYVVSFNWNRDFTPTPRAEQNQSSTTNPQ